MKKQHETNRALIVLMHQYNLSHKNIAKVLECAKSTVYSYTCDRSEKYYRKFPNLKLRFLKTKIHDFKQRAANRPK